MLLALDKNNWSIKSSAITLNISRTALYDLMQASKKVRRVEDITDKEIDLLTSKEKGDINMWAKELRVGKDSLRRRLKEMNFLYLL